MGKHAVKIAMLGCAGAILGSACGIASWLACAQIMNGSITIITTGLNPPLLTGNVFSVGISAILVVAISLIFPDQGPFDWELYKERITTADDTVSQGPLTGVRISGLLGPVPSCTVLSLTAARDCSCVLR